MDKEQGGEDSIQVLVRIKPGSEDQSVIYNHNEIKLDRHTFAFDKVFPPDSQQQDIFVAVGKKLIYHTLEGYNSCIFVYGQTGSGKTYTMMGENNGLMQRSFCQLFSKVARMTNNECIISCSYYEIYNEQIIDLLDNRRQKKNLNIRQDVKKGMFVQNLIEQSALNSEKLLQCLAIGMKNRHNGQTLMNRQSSRSHSIFTISLAMKQDDGNKKVLKTSKLHFVDLAGSQRQKMTMATGERLKQAGNINKSLTSLGMVINALASDKPKIHIPYRDSKLTCLLKDSLGGNSKTFIVATISASILCFQQTLSTLNFANRAKMVKVKALINEQSLSSNVEQYKEEIRRLKQEIAKIKSQKRYSYESINTNALESMLSKNTCDLEYKFQEISSKIQGLKQNLMNNSLQNIIQLINKAKPEQQMIDENMNFGNQQQGNQLIQYMASNHEMLKKIHSTMKQYSDLKEEIKNIQLRKRNPFQEMKTPSKFQRQQYEQLLTKRQIHIRELQQKLVSMKQQIFKKDLESRDLKRKISSMMETKQNDSSQDILTLKMDYSQLQRKYNECLLLLDTTRDENKKRQEMNRQLQIRLKQSKELYLYFQDRYESQKFLKTKLQGTIKQLTKKVQTIQLQKRQQVQDYIDKIQIIEQKMLQIQRRQQQMKNENEILNETLQFNQKKIKEYTDKLHELNRQINQYGLKQIDHHDKINQIINEKQQNKLHYQTIISSLTISKNQFKNTLDLLNLKHQDLQNINQQLYRQYQYLKSQKSMKINLLNEQLSMWQHKNQQNIQLLEDLNFQQRQQLNQHNLTTFTLQRTINNMKIQLQLHKKDKKLLEQKLQQSQRLRIYEKSSFQQKQSLIISQNQKYKLQVQTLNKKLIQQQQFRNKYKNIAEQFEQLKKSYKEILTLNYKLKGQYYTTYNHSINQSTKNEELLSKVVFYEEKFKLMSLEYNKSLDIIKKLKQKELNLLKDLQFYKENEKLKKFSNSPEADEVHIQTLKALQLQNSELKQELTKMNKMYQSLIKVQKQQDYSLRVNLQNQRYELCQKQQKIKKKMQNALKNWDHMKQNNYQGMNIDELLNCWQKIQLQSRKKIDGIGKAIKRQQKLQSQNRFIIKENNFLKQRIQQLQKQLKVEGFDLPRKLIKIQSQRIS